jgi:ATP-binding cassette, subfamily F, member 3
VVAGPNGAGKSTLLKLIAGVLNPQQGEIVIDCKTQVSYYDQEQKNLNRDNTVLAEVARVSQSSPRDLRSLLARFLFSAEAVNQKVGTLSLGERSRLALAKIALQGRNLLLLDEPTNHLDPATSAVIGRIICQYNGTVVVVTHDAGFIETLQVQRMLLLPEGRVINYDRHEVERHQK